MKQALKLKILNSPLYLIISKIINVFGVKKSVSGENNVCDFCYPLLFRKSQIHVEGINNKIIIHKKCRCRNLCIEVCGNNNTVELKEGVMFYERGYISIKGDHCNCILGKGSTVGSASFFVEESDTQILLGEDCMLGRNISISTTDFHSIIDATTGKRINTPGNVVLGNHVWVGSSADIGKSVVISDNTIVGAHAVVTKMFSQENICLAGMPAKVIRENVTWCREKL